MYLPNLHPSVLSFLFFSLPDLLHPHALPISPILPNLKNELWARHRAQAFFNPSIQEETDRWISVSPDASLTYTSSRTARATW